MSLAPALEIQMAFGDLLVAGMESAMTLSQRLKQRLSLGGGVILLAFVFTAGRCSSPTNNKVGDIHDPALTAAHTHNNPSGSLLPKASTVWTCSMHPQVQQSQAGQCPICAMDLIPRSKSHDLKEGPRVLTMSKSAAALADIQLSVVEQRYPQAQVRLVGKLDYDETRVRSLAARFPARIDRLFVNFNGVVVQQGEHLAQVYSPELLTTISELLTSYRVNPNSTATTSAKEKLRLWDLLPEQIEHILKQNKPMEAFELLAPISGVVVQKNVNEGDYVKTGQPLFKIVDLSHLWLRLDAYESDLVWLRFGQRVEFSVEAFPGETFDGHISFIAPELNRKTRTVALRVNVPNSHRRLKPGMFAKAQVHALIANSGLVYSPELQGKWISPMHPQIVKNAPGQCDICGMDLVPVEKMGIDVNEQAEAPLIVPTSAVLRTGKRAVVYVKKAADLPTFEGREIVLGPRAGDFYLVTSGLNVGEEVVTHGAFKIDSALQIQAKPSMMNPKGGAVMHGHEHDTPESSALPAHPLKLDIDVSKKLLPHYFKLQTALTEDDLNLAKQILNSMMSVTGHQGHVAEWIHTMLLVKSIDNLRKPYFDLLSHAMIQQLVQHPDEFDQTVYQKFCPKGDSDRGASWRQAGNPLRKPYLGSEMWHCGVLENTYKADSTIVEAQGHAR